MFVRNQLNLTATELLAYSLVRIESEYESGILSIGTGFLFNVIEDQGSGLSLPAFVTNKHVISGGKIGRLCLTLKNTLGGPDPKRFTTVTVDQFESQWLHHPDPAIDLAIMPAVPIINQAKSQDGDPFIVPISNKALPSANDLADLQEMEDIFMVGYPDGIWDNVHNKPIFRRGICATHPNLDYQGRSEFLIDAACFPGSSGSPVLTIHRGSYVGRSGVPIVFNHTRVNLLGVLYAGPQYSAAGDIRLMNLPTLKRESVVTEIPINLGAVIKASRLADFESLLAPLLSSHIPKPKPTPQ